VQTGVTKISHRTHICAPNDVVVMASLFPQKRQISGIFNSSWSARRGDSPHEPVGIIVDSQDSILFLVFKSFGNKK
jgi:hypothetical protein